MVAVAAAGMLLSPGSPASPQMVLAEEPGLYTNGMFYVGRNRGRSRLRTPCRPVKLTPNSTPSFEFIRSKHDEIAPM